MRFLCCIFAVSKQTNKQTIFINNQDFIIMEKNMAKTILEAIKEGKKFSVICEAAGLEKSGKGCILDGVVVRAEKLIRMASTLMEDSVSYKKNVATETVTKTKVFRSALEAAKKTNPISYIPLHGLQDMRNPLPPIHLKPILSLWDFPAVPYNESMMAKEEATTAANVTNKLRNKTA